MKIKQLKTIGLLVVVIIIWGYLVYKVIASLNPDDSSGVIQNQLPAFKKNTEQIALEKFDLFIPYRDPFLDVVLVKPKPKKSITKPKSSINAVNLDMIWSNILYKGMIAKKSSNQYLYLVKIKGKEVVLKPKQSYQDYNLIKANEKIITLKYKTYTKTFPVSKSY